MSFKNSFKNKVTYELFAYKWFIKTGFGIEYYTGDDVLWRTNQPTNQPTDQTTNQLAILQTILTMCKQMSYKIV